jgi:protein-S-isoprenylcysteine O-methyltransferase Ste14
MKHVVAFLVRVALLALVCFTLVLTADARLSKAVNLAIIVAGVPLTLPVAWLGRRVLLRHPTPGWAAWTTTLVHVGLGFTLGVPLVRALTVHRDWPGWVLPVPPGVGWVLVVVTGAACFLTVVTLAARGFGAPFFIVLSRKLAADWLYAWTRNPMILATLAFFLALGIWHQSPLLVLWVPVLFTPALLFYVKVFEEKELEIRFGASYLAYKARTPMLLPRRPRA